MSDRRDFLALAGAALLARFLADPGVAWASERNVNAFNARSPESVYAALGLSAPEESGDIIILKRKELPCRKSFSTPTTR